MLFYKKNTIETNLEIPFESNILVSSINNAFSFKSDDTSLLVKNKVSEGNKLEQTYSKSAIDQSIVDRMWVLFSSSSTDISGKPHISKTIKEEIAIRELLAIEEPTPERIKFLHLRKRLYKGSNKHLPLPVVLMNGGDVFNAYQFNQFESACKGKATTLFCVCFPQKEELYKLTESNLIKHMGYDIKSAKCFVKEHKRWGMDFHFLKREIQDCWGVLRGNTGGDFIWDKSPCENGVFRGTGDGSALSDAIDSCDTSLPITSLKTWKEISKECYERNHPGKSFYNVSTATQTRFLVNTIRHNSIYEQSYKFASPDQVQQVRDKALSSIMREIAWRFPLLRNEVTIQLNEKFSHWA
ncbi:hypothetical protein [Photobacterium kishitanii]|uniref:Uncharacterized protein n=1 Tax=Photobacterium kishitanii TaxID=318456 RepID=A0A2T3KME4_9GAMM|nr:hypothetical protein [Photobacterium kishitanii]PSV00961.1 hypothetical protein C9J27_02745 [Photobacterium kishitanii]